MEELKNNYIKRDGLRLSVDKHRPTRHDGAKPERIRAELNPRYENQAMWHYQGGMIHELELELRQSQPKHDDLKDVLASAVGIARPASRSAAASNRSKVVWNARFGGVA